MANERQEQYKGSTKTQRKKLAKEKKRVAKYRAKRKKVLIRWSARIVLVTLLMGIGYGAYATFFRKPHISNQGILRIATPEHNFGVVHVRGGIVTTKIPLVNIGEGSLTISGLDSSCGCTRASVVNNGVEGPTFGMAGHGKNPKDWHTVINPGEQAFLKVYYDPTVHPDLRGPVTRIVTIHSDDPRDPEQEVKIKVYQSG